MLADTRVVGRALRLIAGFTLGAVCLGAPVSAADGEQDRPTLAAPAFDRTPDFFVGAPRVWWGLRGSQLFPRAGGDLFSFVTDQLTLDRQQFRARGFATDLGVRLSPRLDLIAGFDRARRTAPSEYRRFVASNAQPIAQQTELSQHALAVGVRVSPLGHGLEVSRFAFIPRRVTPYAGAGAVLNHYRFSQRGQFVDANDLSIFGDSFSSDGWSMGPYVNGGVDVQLWKRLYLSFDGRYSWVHSSLGSDFTGFDGIDLAGLRASSGIRVAF